MKITVDSAPARSSERLRIELRELFASGPVRAQLARIRAGTDGLDGDPRPIYRLMAEAGALAVMWPPEHGGAGGGPEHVRAVLEEMVRHDVPITLHYVTTYIVGGFVALAGTVEQRRRLLPAMARGELFGCVLLTELEAGSDLGALATTARRTDGGWLVRGRKTFNNQSHLADVGLCLARTSDEASRYQGMTLLLVPMHDAGVRRRALPNLWEHLHDVELDDVFVPDDGVVGEVGQGWHLVNQLMGGERSGIDYYARGLRTLELVEEALRAEPRRVDDSALEHLGRLAARLDAGRALAMRVLASLTEGRPDVRLASVAKWHCSESAQRVAWWALEALGPAAAASGGPPAGLLEHAYRAAPMMTISGGVSETLLDTIAVSSLDRVDGDAGLDPLQAGLREVVREALSEEGESWGRLVELGVPGFGVPVAAGGLDIGLAAQVVVGLEAGRALAPPPGCHETAWAAGALAGRVDHPDAADLLAAVAAGRCHVAPVGLRGAGLSLDPGGRLSGVSEPLPRVPWSAAVARAAGPAGEVLVLLRLPHEACGAEPVETLAGPAGRLRFAGAGGAVTLAAGGEVGPLLERPLAGAAVRQAALLAGIAEAAILAARDHTDGRRQFDRRLRDFQTVSHRLAALAAELEGVLELVHEAGRRCDDGRPVRPWAGRALAAAAELALAATRLAVQLHGARGMLEGSAPARAYRLAAWEAVRLGTPGSLWRDAGRLLLEGCADE